MSDLARDLARDHRPKKKKKEKKPSKALLIGLIAGGAVLVIGIIVVIMAMSGGGGKGEKKDEPKKKGPDPGYVRPLEEKEALAKLQEIGKGYQAHVAKKGKGPSDLKDLSGFIDADLKTIIDPKTGWVDMFYDWTPTLLPEGSSKTVVAQESQPFKGTYVVLLGDGSAKLMTEAELAKAPRAPKAKPFVPGPLVTEGGKTRLGKLRYVRILSDLETKLILEKLGQSFFAFDLDRNRGPKELNELGREVATDGRLQEALDPKEGWLEFTWGVGSRGMPNPGGTILAFEREPVAGMRYVIYGNGRSDRISEEEFAKLPKAKGK